MKKKKGYLIVLVFLCMTLVVPPYSYPQGSPSPPVFKAEELEQILAPIALHPDSLLTQILMASTYPLEIVQADRWAKQNKNMKGDALTKALEAQPWDPSVKSLVNFPEVLAMMSEKIDWTQKLGDAFLAQQKDVMATVQKLRGKAQTSGNLKTTKEQVVKVEQEVIIIEPASPQTVYVPTYNPTVVYGAWAYPAYPPYYYYPPGYVAGAAFTFAAGVAIGAAWGYAWGGANWRGGDVDVNVNRNTTINNNIDRSKYQNKVTGGQGGQGKWQHNPEHRKGVSYRDQNTRQQYGQSKPGVENRQDFRGQTPDSRDRAGADRGGKDTPGREAGPSTADRGGRDTPNRDAGGRGDQAAQQPRQSNAFDGADRGGNDAKMSSDRGGGSRESMSASSGGSSRSGGGGGSISSGGSSRSGGGGGGSISSGGGSRSGGGSSGGGSRGGGGGGRR